MSFTITKRAQGAVLYMSRHNAYAYTKDDREAAVFSTKAEAIAEKRAKEKVVELPPTCRAPRTCGPYMWRLALRALHG